AVQAMQVGALDYILKPFRLNVMLPVIARALDVQRLRHENAELQERERRRSEDLAAAYQDLESFSYSISHDLRAPLRAVDGYAQILQDDFGARLDDEGRRVVGVIRDGSRKMEQLIVGLLAFSRASRQPLSLSSIDMTAVAQAAVAEVMAGHKGPAPRIEIEELPACAADASVIRQVWCNLIGNALKYSAKQPEPRVRISGTIEEREAVYREAVYRVEDNGAGFDMQYAHKLFGVFQRLHAAEDFAGTGVGLAIVHRIVTRHGGRIWAEGEPGKGAWFQFALPAAST
ncbi:MAG: ATP-binding protein, partial [Steroidobacteraceae bacterium]